MSMSQLIAVGIAGLATFAGLVQNSEKIGSFFSPARKRFMSYVHLPDTILELNEALQCQIAELSCRLDDQHKKQLARDIANPDMPIEERYAAGCEYLDIGGNGAIKHMFETEIIPSYNRWLSSRNGVA